jgi:hypothetical protein
MRRLSEASFFLDKPLRWSPTLYGVSYRSRPSPQVGFLASMPQLAKEGMPRPANSKHERQRNSINGCFLDTTHCRQEDEP